MITLNREEKHSPEEMLMLSILDIRDKFPQFKYECKGLTFAIKEKGWFGKRLYHGVIDIKDKNRIVIDALDVESDGPSRRVGIKWFSAGDEHPKNLPKTSEDNEILRVGAYLEATLKRQFNQTPIFNMVEKVKY